MVGNKCRCGESMILLKEKGSNIGVYCYGCGKWQKWVGKKDLPRYRANGYTIFKEDYEPVYLNKKNESRVVIDEEPSFDCSINSVVSVSECVCGGNNFFLRDKGNNVGLYCSDCGKWLKWVGKSLLPKLKVMGYEVHNEFYEPVLKAVKMDDNLGLVDNNEDEYVDFDFEMDGVNHKEVVDEVIGNNLGSKEPCDTCNKGTLNRIAGNCDAVLFENVLTIYAEDKKTLLGIYKLDFCPSCGRKLNN